MLTQDQADDFARREVKKIAEHVDCDLSGNEELKNRRIASVYHYVIAGTHVDPDDGYEYVNVKHPLNRKEKSAVNQCRIKVREIEKWLVESLTNGDSAEIVQQKLESRQNYPVVSIALSLDELETTLKKLFALDYCYPQQLDGGYFDILPHDAIIYGWYEALSCAGGITDRYGDAELAHQENGGCLLYTSPSPRDQRGSRMPSSA